MLSTNHDHLAGGENNPPVEVFTDASLCKEPEKKRPILDIVLDAAVFLLALGGAALILTSGVLR